MQKEQGGTVNLSETPYIDFRDSRNILEPIFATNSLCCDIVIVTEVSSSLHELGAAEFSVIMPGLILGLERCDTFTTPG